MFPHDGCVLVARCVVHVESCLLEKLPHQPLVDARQFCDGQMPSMLHDVVFFKVVRIEVRQLVVDERPQRFGQGVLTVATIISAGGRCGQAERPLVFAGRVLEGVVKGRRASERVRHDRDQDRKRPW